MPSLETIENEIRAALAHVVAELKLDASLNRIWEQPPIAFHPQCVAAVRKGGFIMRPVGAAISCRAALHDAAYVSRVAPAGMIFVPCKDGITHNEEEFSSQEQCAKGAQVLLQAVLDFDRQLAEGAQAAKSGR